MTPTPHNSPKAASKAAPNETLLFIKRWLKHPIRLGAIAPSSPGLTNLISSNVKVKEGHIVVELGAGTGTVTRSLLKNAVTEDQLIVVELDPELCGFLKDSMPTLRVLQGNSTDLATLLPPEFVGKVSTIVSGMPVSTMPFKLQKQIIDACFSVLAPGGEVIQYSYHHHASPLPASELGLSKKKIGMTFKNLPPACLWRYQKAA